MKKTVFIILLTVAMTALLFAAAGWLSFKNSPADEMSNVATYDNGTFNATPVNFINDEASGGMPIFTSVAKQSLPAVVHIGVSASVDNRRQQQMDPRDLPAPFRDFFRDRGAPQGRQGAPMQQGSGSGVIISSDGYIITNNHVIDNANNIEVTLNDQRQYKAKLIGADPSTDIALIKIEEAGLPTLPFGNSDEVEVGEWVLAVGNPFNLASTVTAGIVSAKGRNINIVQGQMPIESFIQTDAAINPGNSGGALINLRGELIGINTAIASPSGVYAGYAFAVPAQIVEKVKNDLEEFGIVQRGVLGVSIRSINGNFAKEKDLAMSEGVYVNAVTEGGAAAASGVREGDVIVAVNGMETKTSAALIEYIGRQRPGDEVEVQILRAGKSITKRIELQNMAGTTELVNREPASKALSQLGIALDPISDDRKKELGIRNGVQVSQIMPGVIYNETNMQEGFIILKANGKKVDSEADLKKIIEETEGGIMLEGRYPNSDRTQYYAFGVS